MTLIPLAARLWPNDPKIDAATTVERVQRHFPHAEIDWKRGDEAVYRGIDQLREWNVPDFYIEAKRKWSIASDRLVRLELVLWMRSSTSAKFRRHGSPMLRHRSTTDSSSSTTAGCLMSHSAELRRESWNNEIDSR